MLKLFKRKGKAVKRWRSKAWLIDPHVTKLAIIQVSSEKPEHLPPWMFKLRCMEKTIEGFEGANIQSPLCQEIENAMARQLRTDIEDSSI